MMKSIFNPFFRHSLAFVASSLFLSIGSVSAATYDWNGSVDSNFTNGSNWEQNDWTQWDDYRFGSAVTSGVVTINGYFGIASLTLESGLTQDIVITSSSAQPFIMSTAIANSGLALISIDSASKDLTINGDCIASTAVTWEIGTGRTFTLNGPLNNWFNPAAVVKNGSGNAILTQKSNYTGGTTVNGGTLSLADGDWVTGQPWDGTGATGAVTVGSGATLSTSAGVTQFKNGLNMNGGTLSSRGNTYGFGHDTWGNVLLGSNITAGNSTTSLISSEIRLDSDRTIDVGIGSTLNISGGIAISPNYTGGIGNCGITKTGLGTLVFSGSTSYTGNTVISDGALDLNVASGVRDSAGTSFSGMGTLRKTGAGGIVWGGGASTFAMSAGSWIDVQEGAFTGGSNANENWSGNLSGLNVASGASFHGVEANIRVDALTGAGTITSGYPGAGYQNFTFGVNNGSGTFSGSLTDSDTAAANFVKVGSGTQTLTGTLNYDGSTTVSGGTLELPDGDWKTGGRFSSGMGASGTIIVGAGATLSTSAGVTGLQNGLVLNGGTVNSRGLVYSNYRNLLLESNITAEGAATSTISSEISLAGDRGIAVGADSTLNITGSIANDGFFGGSQGITKTGAGILSLSAANTYTGNTSVNEGQLILGGGVNNTALSDSADLIVASGATLQLNYSAGNTDTIDELWLGGVQQSPGFYGAGTYSGVTISGTGLLYVSNGPPADPFANWMSTNYPTIVSPDNQPDADPDDDGIENLVEYVLEGGDPSASSTLILPTVEASGASFVFTYYRRAAATGTTQTFQYGTDLTGWTDLAIPGGFGVAVTDEGGGIDKVEITVPKGSNTKLFGRLQVVK